MRVCLAWVRACGTCAEEGEARRGRRGATFLASKPGQLHVQSKCLYATSLQRVCTAKIIRGRVEKRLGKRSEWPKVFGIRGGLMCRTTCAGRPWTRSEYVAIRTTWSNRKRRDGSSASCNWTARTWSCSGCNKDRGESVKVTSGDGGLSKTVSLGIQVHVVVDVVGRGCRESDHKRLAFSPEAETG